MPIWGIWVVVAAACTAGELLTPGLFFLACLVPAAGIAAILDAAGVEFGVQLAVFLAGSVVTLLTLRPLARRHLVAAPEIRTNADALVGVRARVLEPVDAEGGRVKLRGEVWTARARDRTAVIEAGTEVLVERIDGATAVVTEVKER